MQFLDPRGVDVHDFELELIDAAEKSIFSVEFLRREVRRLEQQNKVLIIVDPGHTFEIDMFHLDRNKRQDIVEFIEKHAGATPEVKRHIENQTGKVWRSN